MGPFLKIARFPYCFACWELGAVLEAGFGSRFWKQVLEELRTREVLWMALEKNSVSVLYSSVSREMIAYTA